MIPSMFHGESTAHPGKHLCGNFRSGPLPRASYACPALGHNEFATIHVRREGLAPEGVMTQSYSIARRSFVSGPRPSECGKIIEALAGLRRPVTEQLLAT